MLNANSIAFLVVDVQARLVSVIQEVDALTRRVQLLVRGAGALNLPVLVSEQYPKGLGHTVPVIAEALPETSPVFEKTSFSCFGCTQLAVELDRFRPRTLVLTGVETHVCVQQTALDALQRGFEVVLPADAVRSRNAVDQKTSLTLLRSRGATVTTVEAILFALVRDAKHPAFKAISKLVKEA